MLLSMLYTIGDIRQLEVSLSGTMSRIAPLLIVCNVMMQMALKDRGDSPDRILSFVVIAATLTVIPFTSLGRYSPSIIIIIAVLSAITAIFLLCLGVYVVCSKRPSRWNPPQRKALSMLIVYVGDIININ